MTYVAHPELEIPFVVAVALVVLKTLEYVRQLGFQASTASGTERYAPATHRGKVDQLLWRCQLSHVYITDLDLDLDRSQIMVICAAHRSSARR